MQSKIMDDQNGLSYVDLGVNVRLTNANKVAILEGSWPTSTPVCVPAEVRTIVHWQLT